MKDFDVNTIFKVLLTIFLIVIGVNFFVALLPFILIGLLIYMIYKKIKDNQNNMSKQMGSQEIRKSGAKKGKIIGEAQIVSEKVVEE